MLENMYTILILRAIDLYSRANFILDVQSSNLVTSLDLNHRWSPEYVFVSDRGKTGLNIILNSGLKHVINI